MPDARVTTYTRVHPSLQLAAQFRAFVPVPTTADFEKGSLTRYFAQQTNQPTGEVTEVAKQTFQALKNVSLFRAVAVPWVISGPDRTVVTAVNQAAVKTASKVIPTLNTKLTNLLQLWRGH